MPAYYLFKPQDNNEFNMYLFIIHRIEQGCAGREL